MKRIAICLLGGLRIAVGLGVTVISKSSRSISAELILIRPWPFRPPWK